MNISTVANGRVFVVGDIMTDTIVVSDGPPVVGSDKRATICVVEGGSAANQAAWLAASSVPVALFARVAKGDVAAMGARLKAQGIEPILSGDEAQQSGRLVTLIGSGGERSFFTDRGANLALDLADLPDDWYKGTDLLVLSGYSFFEKGPRACATGLIKAAQKHGVPIVVDAASSGFIADAGVNKFLKWTAGADLLVANQDETALLSGRYDPEDQMMVLLGHYQSIIVKRGAKGSLFRRRGERPVYAQGVKAEVVDTTGAGDAFLAGFIAAWRQGGEIIDCLAAGNRLGAVAIAKIGGRPPEKI